MSVDVVDRTSEAYYWCINEINCTGTNMSKDLLYALGEAEANMYLCSKELRPSENEVYLFFYDEAVANEQLVSFYSTPFSYRRAQFNTFLYTTSNSSPLMSQTGNILREAVDMLLLTITT